ncbi:MAG: hypothetical protein RDV48_30715 [Candidatus Eremiobacteraeota bacterium]|nr:hypothetical protein [Candidatus Eremiobacteraeota bacterium]
MERLLCYEDVFIAGYGILQQSMSHYDTAADKLHKRADLIHAKFSIMNDEFERELIDISARSAVTPFALSIHSGLHGHHILTGAMESESIGSYLIECSLEQTLRIIRVHTVCEYRVSFDFIHHEVFAGGGKDRVKYLLENEPCMGELGFSQEIGISRDITQYDYPLLRGAHECLLTFKMRMPSSWQAYL